MPTSGAVVLLGDGPIVLFDGVCNLCNGVVDWIIARDRAAVFRFAALQSEAGRRLFSDLHVPPVVGETSLVLIEGRRCYTRSTAVLRIARSLRWPWRAARGLGIVPRPVRDAMYDLIARHRLQWFGRRETCRVPGPDLKGRFLS